MIGRCLFVMFLLLSSPVEAAPPTGERQVEVISALIEAEFALQSGQLNQAAAHYLRAARVSGDVELAERATSIAVASGDRDVLRAATAHWVALAPDAPAAHAQRLALALADGEREVALSAAHRLLAFPDDRGWPLLLRRLSDAAGDSKALVSAVLATLPTDAAMPGQIQAWLAFAGLARRLGEDSISGELIETALARFPDDPNARLLEASRQRERGEVEAAQQALEALLASDALTPIVRRAAARELASAGKPLRAAELLKAGENSVEDYALRASWLIAAADEDSLRAFHEEMLAVDASAVPLRAMVLGHVSEALDRFDEAESWYRQVEGPQAELAQQRLAWVLHRQGSDPEAIAVLRILQSDMQADGERVREAYLLEARLHAIAKRDGDALAAYARALTVFENDPVLLYSRALYHEAHDRVDRALADLRRVLEQDADNAAALNAYGYTLMERQQRYEEALPYIERAHVLDANSPAILDSIGWLRYRMGRPHEALPLLQKAWQGQQDAEIAAHLGEVLWHLGREDEARAIWRAGLALSPEHPALAPVLERMK